MASSDKNKQIEKAGLDILLQIVWVRLETLDSILHEIKSVFKPLWEEVEINFV